MLPCRRHDSHPGPPSVNAQPSSPPHAPSDHSLGTLSGSRSFHAPTPRTS